MSLAHVLLTSLLEKPNSGYELAQRFDKSMGFFWFATHQQIYRELKRMEEAGWIDSYAATDAGKTKKRTYTVRAAGIAELQLWVQQDFEPPALRDELLVRLRAGASLGTLGMEQQLKHQLTLHEQRLATYTMIAQRDFANTRDLEREKQIQARILQLGIDFEQVRIQWMQQTIDLLEQLATTDVAPSPEILSY